MNPDLSSHRIGAEGGNPVSLAFFDNAPKLIWEWHWWAYGELATDRPPGMGGILPIPRSAIQAMADEEGLTGYDRFLFKYVMRGLDNHLLEKERERAERQKSKSR